VKTWDPLRAPVYKGFFLFRSQGTKLEIKLSQKVGVLCKVVIMYNVSYVLHLCVYKLFQLGTRDLFAAGLINRGL
jgi:hypothetical protein